MIVHEIAIHQMAVEITTGPIMAFKNVPESI